MKEIFVEWSVCTQARGYVCDSPLDSMGSAEFAEGRMTSHEKAVAQRDIVCKKKVDLVTRWNAVESDMQARMINDNKAVLDRFLSLQTAKVEPARKLLAEGG
ncbi:hypothetical protein [Streptomyces incanus]|uniref:Uncharacterized protein n=1 Tax=Streptomyces incanus TaxID=887453 RepID=A0ABW0XWL3_9ACTN